MKVAVIGLGRFGQSLVENLVDRGVEVIAIDKNRERVDAVKDKATLAVILDSEDEKVLKAQGIDKVDVAVVSMGENDFRSNVLTTVLLKKIGVKTVISRAFEHIDKEILENIGADKVVFAEVELGQKLARSIATPNLLECIPMDENENYSIAQIQAPKKFLGKKIGDLQVASKYHVNIILIRHNIEYMDKNGKVKTRETFNYVPSADTVIDEDDILWVAGKTDDIENISKL
ncbi:MAG: potassium channel family protein [bacterium]